MRGILSGAITLLLLAPAFAYSDEGDGKGRVLDFNSARVAKAQKEEPLPTESLFPEVKPLSEAKKVVSFQPKAKPAPVDPNEEILPILNNFKDQAERVLQFTRQKNFNNLTQNSVNILVRNIDTLEKNQFAADSYRHWTPTSGKLVDEVLEAQKQALDAVKSSGFYERLEADGFYVKLVPVSTIKKTVPVELLESIRAATFTNQFRGMANFMPWVSITPGLSRLQERLRLPPRPVKVYLSVLSGALDSTLEVMDQARNYLSKNAKGQYDLEGVDALIEETRKGLQAKETSVALSVFKKSLIKSDRDLAASVESKIKRLEPILGYIEMRGQFAANAVAKVSSSNVSSVRKRGRAAHLFDELLTGDAQVQNQRFANWMDSKGVPTEDSLEYLFTEGAYNEGLSSDELLTIVRKLQDRMPSSEKHRLPELMADLAQKLSSKFFSPVGRRGAQVGIMKMAAVLHGLGDESSYHALELINAQSPRIVNGTAVFSQESKEVRDYFSQLVNDLKSEHPEYKSSLSAARLTGICVMNVILKSLPNFH